MEDLELKWLLVGNGGIVTYLASITSLAEFQKSQWGLMAVFEHANPAVADYAPHIYFRGENLGQNLGENRKTSTESLKRTFEMYRRETGCTEPEDVQYVRMRHSGVMNTALLDWTNTPEIAIWFAIHERDGSLKKSGGALWAFLYRECDFRVPKGEEMPIPDNGASRSIVYLPNEEIALARYGELDRGHGERPIMQDVAEVRLRMTGDPNENGYRELLPMTKDEIFKGRLLAIEIEGDYEHIDAELRAWLAPEMTSPNQSFHDYLGLEPQRDATIVQELNKIYEEEMKKNEGK